MSRFIKKLTNLILILVIVALSLYFVLRALNKIQIYTVKTGSMEDNIHVGDYILILKKNDYKIGDIVTFKSGGGFITHRIIDINGDEITTKGDANNIKDDSITKDIIVGKVIISGGILNIIINYKFAIVGMLLSFYLLSCYFGDDEKDNNELKYYNTKSER